ncbi:hypothetical protein SAMN04489738_2167 [Pseudarthrobacter chlorophenolicus]|nr:hypothetical protein SAMN04489738_2167 [Pseudarthrobacter chlorophenolicus]
MTQERLLEEAPDAKVARSVSGHGDVSGRLGVSAGAGYGRQAYNAWGALTQMATHTSS